MEELWMEYHQCQKAKPKESLWQNMLLQSIEEGCKNNLLFTHSSEFANTLGSQFLSAIDEQCALCEDEPQTLIKYLSQGPGCHMLIALSLYGEQVTTCCNELCTLLLSITPLIFQGSKENDEDIKLLPVKANPSSFKSHFQALSQKLIGLQSSVKNKSSCSSSELSDSANSKRETDVICASLSERIKAISVPRKELFYQILSAFLQLAQNDYMLRDTAIYLSFIEKCLHDMSNDHLSTQKYKLSHYHYYGLIQIVMALLSNVVKTKDGLSMVNTKTFYTELLAHSQMFVQNKTTTVCLYLSLSTIKSAVTVLCQSINQNTLYAVPEILKLIEKFLELSYFQFLRKLAVSIDTEIGKNGREENRACAESDTYLKHCILCFDLILKQLSKISKQLKGLKGQCSDNVTRQKQCETSKFKHPHVRRPDKNKRQSNNSSSNDIDSDLSSRSEIENQSDDESAENLSDFDNFFVGSSDAEEQKKSVEKPKAELIVHKKGGAGCFSSLCSQLFSGMFSEIQQPDLQESIVNAMMHIGVCKCVDLDQYLVGISSRLPRCEEIIVDKSLALISHLVSSYFNLLIQTPKMRNLSRGGSGRQRISPKSMELETVEEKGYDVADGKKKSYQFIAKFKQYLAAANVMLKVHLLRHIKAMIHKTPQALQKELFCRVVLPNFKALFPTVQLTQGDVEFSSSDPSSILKLYLEVLLTFLKHDDQLMWMFYQQDCLAICKILALSSDAEVSLHALSILEVMGALHSSNNPCQHEGKGSKIRLGTSESKYDEISKQSVLYLVQIFTKLFNKKDDSNSFFTDNESILLNVLSIIEHLRYQNGVLQKELEEESVKYRYFRLFEELIAQVCERKKTLQSCDEKTGNAEPEGVKKKIYLELLLLLDWLKTLLPLQLKMSYADTRNEQSIENILDKLRSSFLHNTIIFSELGHQVCLVILQSATTYRKKRKHNDSSKSGRDENLSGSKSPTNMSNNDEKGNKSFILQEEKGYEADQESEDSDNTYASRSSLTVFFDHHKMSTSSAIVAKSPSNQLSVHIIHPWLCTFLLNYLAETLMANGKREKLVYILNIVLNELLSYQMLSTKNNMCLCKEGLLSILMKKFSFVFDDDFNKETQHVIGKIMVHLSKHMIVTNDMKIFFELFKQSNVSRKLLSSILLNMTELAVKHFSPCYFMSFPLYFDDDHVHLHGKKSLHKAQSFLVHKQDNNVKHLRSRSQSWSSVNDIGGTVLKPIGLSSQQPALESAMFQLPLESKFVWPDKEFSISLWYNLEDNTYHRFDHDENARMDRKTYNRQRSFSLVYERSSEGGCEYNCEELFHLCSFGGTNAMFEVWIGAKTGCLQFRWITTNHGISTEEQLTTFDQVIIPQPLAMNKWHHLVITLVLPSQPHTAEILTILDGCQLATVQMKYPSRAVYSQTKLVALLGHGYKKDDKNVVLQHNSILKTGMFMIFQGQHSSMDHKKKSVAKTHSPVIDKIKAIYLYSLGPNSSNVNTEYQELFSNQVASHMDSSLNWDSIVFKELSFCMNILSEELITNKFPMKLFESPMETLDQIKAELKKSLMLVFNPQCHTEFRQFIPQLKKSGQIQHIYLTEANNGSTGESCDGNNLETLLLGDIKPHHMQTFQDAVHNCGGMAVLLYLHAMVAEYEKSEEAQSSILRSIFLVQNNCSFLLREMNDLAGYVLISRVLKLSPCRLNAAMMRALLESICDGQIFVMADDEQDKRNIVKTNTTAIVKNVCILQIVLKDWHLMNSATTDVQEMFWKVMEALICPEHPNAQFNIMQFQRARVVENLLTGCQELQQEKVPQLPASLCKLYIGVINNLLGQPVDLPVLKAICSFLIAIHPTVDTLTLHSALNFYLIAKVTAPDVNLREHSPLRLSKSERNRRTASFNEADLYMREFESQLRSGSPQVILSQEDLSTGSVIQSEVIIHRPSITSFQGFMDSTNSLSFTDQESNQESRAGFSAQISSTPFKEAECIVDGGEKIESKVENPNGPSSGRPSPRIKAKLYGHRRIQSDGNVKFNTSVESPLFKPKPQLLSTESHDYDIISDSELHSSCEGHEEYLVVDGFIDQKVGSFTPQLARKETNVKQPDVLYHLRLGLMKLLKTTLMLLPDKLVTRVFGAILKVEHLLALVHQPSDILREVALDNLLLYLQRGGRDCLANFNRFMGCHLLANQLHQHPITVKIIESCISLLVSKTLVLNGNLLTEIDSKEENICPMAIVPCLTLLEGCIQKPTSFGLLIQFLLKVFDKVESLPLVAFDHGLAHIICNILYGLANEKTGTMQTSWKKESFGHILLLLDWLVNKACCTCQSLYFQMYKDLHLSLENVDIKEKEKKGVTPPLLYKICHFLRHYLIQTALEVFKSSDLYITQTRLSSKGKAQYLSTPDLFGSPGSSRRASTPRNLLNKIRGSIQVIPPPTVATPGEIQERFIDVVTEAVKLATLFNKADHTTECTVFGHALKFLNAQEKRSNDADREFSKDLLQWFFQNITLSLSNEQDNSSWNQLLKATKEELILQANRVIVHFVSPLRSTEVRLHFIHQIMQHKENKAVLQNMLYGNTVSKTRDRYLACLQSILAIPSSQLSTEDIDLLSDFKKLLSKVNFVKLKDQKLLEEMRELKYRKREEEIIKRKEAYRRISDRNAELCQNIANQGMEVSKVIVEEQDRQRQKLLRVVRGNNSKDVEVRKTWRNLIHHLTQERAPWYCKESYPCSWQLDPTEGPSRMRKRLQRCHLEIMPKFFLDGAPAKKKLLSKSQLSYLFAEHCDGDRPTYYSFKTNDTIRFLYHCKRVTPATKNTGEVLIGETHMYFVGDDILQDNNVTQAFFGERDVVSISWRYDEIHEILKRRYALQDNALEIFLTSGRTFLLAFENSKSREEVYEQLVSRELPNLITTTTDLTTLTNKWREGKVSNFEYLMELNKKAGRSFNDLMQYPVFPFILADYESDVLNLHEASSYRNLFKPIACQDKGKEERYIETYDYLKAEYDHRKLTDPENATPPYHYSSHYSNSGTVLHFLVRLPPFTSMFLKYQDNQFDIPDRTFHSMATTWKLSSFVSNTDVKELIPEFFFLQEFLLNGEQYNMGVRQTKEPVRDVNLPTWSNNDPRLFTMIQMQALESSHVSSYLHNWIDLVFGFKQIGVPAIKATNVFHPATYFGVDVNAITDKIHRRALQTMIETYGQTPFQLFTSPHPKRFTKQQSFIPHTMEGLMLNLPKERDSPKQTLQLAERKTMIPSPIDTVQGVQWGDYCGSPSHPPPVVYWVQTYTFQTKKIIALSNSLSAYLCGDDICILAHKNLHQVNPKIGMLTWGYSDMLLRVHSSNTNIKTAFNPMRPDDVTCCEYVPGAEILLVGGTSGVLNVWPVRFSIDGPSLDVVGAKQNLLGHSDAITSIKVCQAYSIAVTTSMDATAILWDLNRLCYIRSIPEHESSIHCVTISDASGDIATACNKDSTGIIYLWTVNAKAIGRISDVRVNCLAFSSLPDGVAVNVIAAGLDNGMIRMWDTWTLQPLRSMIANSSYEPVTALSFSPWNPLNFFSADKSGNVYLFTSSKDPTTEKPPVFIQVTPSN